MAKKPIALIIMDGYGYNPSTYGNAIAAANKPNIDKYMKGIRVEELAALLRD